VEIVATLGTPTKLRELQRALYLRAKKEPKLRFYSLYDKVYRPDILAHAYALAKANGGATGPDGMTFEEIEASGGTALLEELHDELKTKRYRPGPVRRVYIPKLSGGERPLGIPNIRDRVVQTAAKLVLEPIFEADFDPDSYGFRPKRSAHQALAAIRQALEQGMYWVIDADLSAYFDMIPHDHLMKAVAERVVDGAMLALIKRFLEAPIVDERDGGNPRRNRQGTPQGGVVSPLLANLYLHLLDRNFRRRVEHGEFTGRLIRYCDDFVVLIPRPPEAEMAWMEKIVSRLGLKLHPEKTHIRNTRKGGLRLPGVSGALAVSALRLRPDCQSRGPHP
jgi:RNA-directed DNA polymerase